MDSSVVTALMADLSAEPVRTSRSASTIPELDETPLRRGSRRPLLDPPHDEVVRLDAIALLPDLADAYDEPFGDSSAIPTFRVAQIAARAVKVVLTGDGGDEAFGGYLRYIADERLRTLALLPGGLSRAASAGLDAVLALVAPRSRIRRRLRLAGDLVGQDPDMRYDQQMRMMSPELERALLTVIPHWLRPATLATRCPPHHPIDWTVFSATDTLNYLPEDLLVKMDRATMANSLEARSPLLDQDVVQFAAQLPRERKLHRGRSKIVLRAVAKTLMPAVLVDRPKMGFGVPISEWFLGSLGDHYRELALAPDAFVRDVLDQDEVRRLLEEHIAGSHDHGRRLWQMLTLELWGRTWARQPPLAA